jgi:acyl carrier protein
MSGLLIVVLVLGGIGLLVFLVMRYGERAKTRGMELAFAGRESLSEEQFYERYFRGRGVPADVAARVRRIMERVLEADLSRLNAEDDLSKDLSFFWEYDSMADVMLMIELEKEFVIKFSDDETKAMRTVRDIVEGVWQKYREVLSAGGSETPAITKG